MLLLRPSFRLVLATLLACLPAAAATAAQAVPSEAARAVQIVDGDTLLLDDGRELRLVGIQAPKLPLGRTGFEAWPLAEEAKAALAELILGKRLGIAPGPAPLDRHGRLLAQLYDSESGLWIQGALLDRGLARVYSFHDNRVLISEMLARERAARAAGRGIWGKPWYAVRGPEELAADVGSFQLVEGRVVDAAVVRGRGYLNFGADYRSDFTIALDRDALDRFAAAGLAPSHYIGRRLRVRGWIESFNGPMIEATHPEQIEVLDE
ncbi:MAG: thermonuclease family protein [Rhodovibrionaceae bacterium]